MNERRRRNRREENRRRRKRLVIASAAVVLLIFGTAFLFVTMLLPSRNTADPARGGGTDEAGNASGETSTMQQTAPFQSYGPVLTEEAANEASAVRTETGAVTDVPPVTDSASSGEDTANEDASSGDSSTPDDVERKVSDMTLEEKVAQLFFITPEALTGYQLVTKCGDVTYEALKQYPVGGLIYFADNIETPDQTKDMLLATQMFMKRETGIPLFTGVDEEGGRVVRVAGNDSFNVTRFQPMGVIASSGNENEVYNAGSAIGAYLRDLGFNTDFAPVADVLTNPGNTAIGDRSFSSDKDVVSAMARAFSQGLSGKGVLPVYKHFPGHGGTEEDTHDGYAYSMRTLEELRETELVPFKRGIEEGIGMIMVAHISLPQITGNDTPATLSEKIVTELLREEMGFDGVIITDALGMGAIANHYSAGDSAVKALLAGCDMLLMPSDFKSAYNAVLSAVRNGTLQESRIDRSVARILKLKQKLS